MALKRRGPGRPMSRAANYYAKLELEVERYAHAASRCDRDPVVSSANASIRCHYRAGNDLQRLARYIILQRAGFRKLLKKYRKWSGSDCLPQRFGSLLESPNAFHHQNFDEMVLEVSELLATIRDGINNLAQEAQSSPETRFDTLTLSAGAPSGPLRRGTSSSSLLSASEFREPNGDAGRTTFWVHADQWVPLLAQTG